MITPLISVTQAYLGTVLAFLYFYAGFFFILHRRSNRYPTTLIAAMQFSAAVWIVTNVVGDRTTIGEVRLIGGRISFIAAYAVVFFFLLFCLNFRPKLQRITNIGITTFSTLIILAGSIFALHPRGIFLGINSSRDYFQSTPYEWASILLHLSYVVITLIGFGTLLTNRRQLGLSDRKAIALIGLGLVVNVVLLALLSFLSVNNFGTHYYAYYSYVGSFIFLGFIAYAVGRYGALGKNFRISLRVMTVIVISILIGLMSVHYEWLPSIIGRK